jgi:hypothetical protein
LGTNFVIGLEPMCYPHQLISKGGRGRYLDE